MIIRNSVVEKTNVSMSATLRPRRRRIVRVNLAILEHQLDIGKFNFKVVVIHFCVAYYMNLSQ